MVAKRLATDGFAIVVHYAGNSAKAESVVTEIKDAGRLLKFPAHNRAAVTKRDVFEITKRIDGKNVLFDFIEAADVLDVLMSIEFYLTFIRERHAAKELDSLLAP